LFWTQNKIYLGYSKDFDFFGELDLAGYEAMLKK
jgi:hypothetical protein